MLLYRHDTDYEREVIDYLRDFEQQMGKKLETMNPDSPSGAQLCQTYDIVEFPTILATDNDGRVMQTWRGLPLPKMDEVSYYAQEF